MWSLGVLFYIKQKYKLTDMILISFIYKYISSKFEVSSFHAMGPMMMLGSMPDCNDLALSHEKNNDSRTSILPIKFYK